MVAGRTEEAWEYVFEYEEPWLNWASDLDWLASMKAAIQIQGSYPNNLKGHAYPPPAADLIETVRAKLVEVFGGETA